MATGASSSSSSSSEEIAVISHDTMLKYLGSLQRNVETNGEYVAFYGVPYARPPLGLKRYQAPESISIQKGPTAIIQTYDARRIRTCYSVQPVFDRFLGTEDCLYLNIYLPKRPNCVARPLPVLVFFHGGGFTSGSFDPKMSTPDYIIQHDVIFVTVSYRLGLHGFLNMHDKKCPGNAGLKDQVKALEWIRDNIENFKGDPENVTISGFSAGGTCVNLHLIAPMSKGLFHKAIVQSGGVYCPWGYKGHLHEVKRRLRDDWECAKLLYAEEDTERLHERVRQLLMAHDEIQKPFGADPNYGPTTETIEEGAFLPTGIDEMMLAEVDPNIPILTGITKNEGIPVIEYEKSSRDIDEWINDQHHFSRFLMDSFRWSRETAMHCWRRMKARCCPNVERLSKDERSHCVSKILHNIFFRRFYDNFKFGPGRTLHKNLFVYQFEHVSPLCRVRRENLGSSVPDVASHGDELNYLYLSEYFREQYINLFGISPEVNRDIKRVTNHMCSLWANFCKEGTPKSDFAPDVDWTKHTEEKPCYLRISTDLVLEDESLCQDDWKWLNKLVNDKPVVESRPPTPELTTRFFCDTLCVRGRLVDVAWFYINIVKELPP